MYKPYLWTKLKARLQYICTIGDQKYNWLFLPGGPGLGSESLTDLTKILDLPGTLWYLDLPGDGSNTTEDDERYFSHWSAALLEATHVLDNVILVAHSSGGMFALATPGLENNLSGLVLMDSAPNASWQQAFSKYVSENPIASAEKLQTLYDKNPSNDNLKNMTIACAPYFSLISSQAKITILMDSLPFNHKTFDWAAKHFDPTYTAKWAPQKTPTLIFAGDQDRITPLELFLQAKEFQRENILIRTIDNAAHFPWLDNPQQVKEVFREYIGRFKAKPYPSI